MFQATERKLRQVSEAMALLSGLSFLLLAVFTTIDVTSRKLGGPFSGITDTVAAFVMAFGATWALAQALAGDAHVRIDVLQTLYGRHMTRLSAFLALLTTTGFSGILAYRAWLVTLESWAIGAYLPQSLVAIRLAWPQGVTAVGYTMLVVYGLAALALSLISQSKEAKS
jgi:TRAP-type mannitol/chloroaromatic compound transport system permease small subunit